MFQTFSGNSRRPRQVNLSGQNHNPFAANSWNPAGSGSQQIVANAEKERQKRQQERDRLSASKTIQRVWRGHKSRRKLADSRRKIWDELDTSAIQPRDLAATQVTRFAQLLLTFFSSKRMDDMTRLKTLGSRISDTGLELFVNKQEMQPYLIRLAKITLEGLQASLPLCPQNLLQLLMALLSRSPEEFPLVSRAYYTYLSLLLSTSGSLNMERNIIFEAISSPLVARPTATNHGNMIRDNYATFALFFLTTPDLSSKMGQLDELAEAIDIDILSSALVHRLSSSPVTHIDQEQSLWLLAHFISLHRLQKKSLQEPEYLRALSLQLSRSSAVVLGRADAQGFDMPQESVDTNTDQLLLPQFVSTELLSLVNKESISRLLERFNVDFANPSISAQEDASLLASYALTLLRIFPRRGDEIRMWLYLGYMSTPTDARIPALKFFWHLMTVTSIFSEVVADSKAALILLGLQAQQNSFHQSAFDLTKRDREWRTILLFLELYGFVLRFTDDEEFLSGGRSNSGNNGETTSRIRASALSLDDVERLTIFLKNMAFTTYYNAESFLDDGQPEAETGLGTLFGTSNRGPRFQSIEKAEISKGHPKRPFAGIAGITFDYVRNVVSGVMRMLYERDSRRRFLLKDHWLMTSRFDMEGFIPAVVMEEERQHSVQEEDDDDTMADTEDDGAEGSRELTGLIGMARPRRTVQIEAMRRQHQKASRQKLMAAIGPRLEVLQNMPFVIPFETRVQIFRQFVLLDQTRRRGGNVDPDTWRMSIIQQNHFTARRNSREPSHDILSRHHARIRRNQVFDDAYEQFYDLGDGLKEPIQITFIDQFNTTEAGIDGGGVTKEFLTSITNEAFRGEKGHPLFIANDQNLLYPNPAAVDEIKRILRNAGLTEADDDWQFMMKDLPKRYEFLGRIIGKCLYEGILVDINFAGFFLRKWATTDGAGYRANIDDLRDLDESLYQGLLKLKNYTGNVEDLQLDFTIADEVALPQSPVSIITRDLVPNGSKIAVTNENRPLYVSCVARHRLQVRPYMQTQAFLRGVSEIISPSWLSMFNQSELQTLIGGDSSGINVEDLRRNTQYGGVYQIGDDGEEHPTIKLFWKVMRSMDDEDRRKVLKYVTSTPRAPLLGFSQLNPRFSIRDASDDETRLPSTSTCVNLLKLPRYSNEDILRKKLLYAVNSGAGFDLS